MSGRPVRTRLLAEIARRGGWDAILDRAANGETITKIAKSFGVSRSFLAGLLHEDDERSKRLYAARKKAAEALAEEALQIIDDAPVSRDDLQKAKLQSEARVWLASKFDSEQFGDRKTQPTVQITIGELHLDALRAQRSERLAVHEIVVPAITAGEEGEEKV